MKRIKDNMQYCYMFLECNPNDTETTIRENFFYKLNEAWRERNGCCNFHVQYFDYTGNDDSNEKIENSYLREIELIRQDMELLCDSYLAIILSRKDPKLYEKFIKGLIKRWDEEYGRFLDDAEYNPYFALRFPREDENIEMIEPEYITKENYLYKLERIYEHTHHHRFGCIPSLAIVINFEKDMMDEHMCLKEYLKQYMPLGRIVRKNEQDIKSMKIKKYVAEGRHKKQHKV